MHKSYNKFLWENAIKQVNTQMNYIYYIKMQKKINQYFKNRFQQKKRVVLLLDVVNIQKTLNQNRIANRLSVGVTRFVMMIA